MEKILSSIILQFQTQRSGRIHSKTYQLETEEKYSKALKLLITSGSTISFLHLRLSLLAGHQNEKENKHTGVIKKALSHMLHMFLL